MRKKLLRYGAFRLESVYLSMPIQLLSHPGNEMTVLVIRIWFFEFIWDLEFGAWFFHIRIRSSE